MKQEIYPTEVYKRNLRMGLLVSGLDFKEIDSIVAELKDCH